MPTLSISKDYKDGDVLLEADLDAIKEDIEEFFNTTRIDEDNLSDGAFTAAKIADGAVNSTALIASNSASDTKFKAAEVTQPKISDELFTLHFTMPGNLLLGDSTPWVRVPFNHTLISAYAVLKTAGSTPTTVNIYYCPQATLDSSPVWTSIFSTALTLDANERSSNTAATAAVLTGTTRDANDHYKMEITAVGTGAKSATVSLKVRRRT